jgi:HlyD family secretion protein
MKRIAIVVLVLAIVVFVIFIALGNRQLFGALQGKAQLQPSASPQVTRAPTSRPPTGRNDEVTAACKLIPINNVYLSFNTPGLVSEVMVTEGQRVEKGELLVSLSNQEQAQASVASAELDLTNAQLALKTLYDEAPLKAAEALQALAKAPEDVADAEGKITGLTRGTFNQAEIDSAEANLIFAESKLKNAQDKYRPYANKNDNNLVRAKLLSDLSQAQKDYEAALRKYNSFFGSPSETSISKAEADLTLARVQQEDAQRKYELLKNGPDPDEVALAQARIANAEAQLAAAQASLANLELRAPFSGTVVTVDLQSGKYVAPGEQILLLVDDSAWRVETTDLTELNIVRIRDGNPVEITFDALPENKFSGKVMQISSLGENRQGDITYRVVSGIDDLDNRLKWNMTCSIVIQTR